MGKKEYTINGTQFTVDDRYTLIKPIGYGAYGFVCAAKDNKSNEKVAIKKVPKLFQDLVDGKRILREIELLKCFHHENIMSITDILSIPEKETYTDVYIVSELMDTDLYQVVRSKQQLTSDHVQYFIYQLLRGLKYIHSANVLHRDLKPSNILVNGNCDLKICDFGLARGFNPENFGEQDFTEYVVTRWYRAPELLLMCQEYTPAIDIWSVGCIFGELLNRKPIFPGKDYIHQIQLITDDLGTPQPPDYQHVTHKEALKFVKQLKKKKTVPLSSLFPTASVLEIDLISKMLVFNPSKRITAEEALKHPYFKSLHDPKDEPDCDHKFKFKFDDCDITEEELRHGIWDEMLSFHPECANDAEKKRLDLKVEVPKKEELPAAK